MTQRADRKGTSRYFLRFGVTAFILIATTLVLVLFVLPQRYVLSSGFRESAVSFPAPSTPFAPLPVVPVAARPLPRPPAEIPPGPAELFWAEVTPMLQAGHYGAALPVFERYLGGHAGDVDVRHEYAITLLAAGRSADAVPVLRAVLATRDDSDDRLLLARTLRELGRTDEASAVYRQLSEAAPDDEALTLEWAQAHSWTRQFERAVAILREGLSRHPSSVPLRVELARAYFSLDRPQAASDALAGIDDADLAAADGLTLRNDIRSALVEPEIESPPPTLADQAATARVAGDFQRSKALFEQALAESPDDPSIWQAYADLLEYEMSDFEGARSALLEVERLSEPPSPELEYRLAQLEIWTSQNDAARDRLTALLASLEGSVRPPAPASAGPRQTAPVTVADVRAALGDLDRWGGDRIGAAHGYEAALDTDPSNQRALDGLVAIRADVRRQTVELEQPRVGGAASSTADTDDFYRVDAGGEWVSLDGPWIWGGTGGNRWLGGLSLDGTTVDRRGVYVDLESARWWRWGTVRTGLDFGAQRVRSTWDYSFGGSLGLRGGRGATAELRYEHGPAYPLTSTLQSALADVVQDRLTLTRGTPLGERWSLAAALDAAWLRAASDSVVPGTEGGTARLQAALSVGRSMSRVLTLGVSARALTFTGAAPRASLPMGGELALFWDPNAAFSLGPYAQLSRDLSPSWKLTGRVTPGVALIDERRSASSGYELVPDVSAEAGVRREGDRFWTSLDLFYSQGRFNGYQAYGARFSLSARDFSTLGGSR